MKRRWMWIAVAAAVVAAGIGVEARAMHPFANKRAAAWQQSNAWHEGYYDVGWGMPVAVLVPPTANKQTNWGWGVGNTRVTPIWPQFQRSWPGPADYAPGQLQAPPAWPSDTTQFGDYYTRGPW